MPASTHRDRDLYDILGVNRTATDLDIKKAFKRLALTWHPDKNPGDKVLAERKFKEITEAYEVLSDRRRREVYDTYGKDYERRSSPHCPHCRTSCCCRDTYTCQQAKKVYREFFGKSSPLTSQGFIPNPYSVPVFTVPSCNASNAWSPPSTSSTGLHSWEGSSGGKGRGFSFQSVTSSVHIVKGRQVLVTRVVEDGIETVTVEEEGVIVSKTVNGVPQRIGSPTVTKNLRSCGTGPCSDDPPPWASTVSTAAQEAAQNARSVRVQTEELPINSNEEPNEAWASGNADKKYTSASVSVSTNEEESQDCAASGPEQPQLGAPHAQSSKGICTVADAPPDPDTSLCMHSHRIAEEVAPGPSREQVDPEGASDVSSSPSHTNISSSDLGCRHRIRRGLRRCVHRSVSTSSSKGSLTGSDVRLAPPVSKRSNRPISIRGFKNATIPTYLKSRVRHIPSAPITRLFSVQGSASCYYEERTESSGNLPRCRVTPPPQGSQDSLEFVAIRRHKSRVDLLSRTEADCSQEKSRNPPISAFAELDVLDSQGRDSSSVFGSQRSLLSIEVHSCGGCDNLLAEDEWFSSPLSFQETDEFNVRRYSSVPHILQIDNPNPRRSASLHSPGPTIRQFLNEIEMASLVVGGRHGVINNTTAVEEIHSSDLNATKTRQSTFGIDDLKNKPAQQHGNIHDQTSSAPALIPKTPSEEGPLRTSSPPWSSSHLHDLPSYMAALTGAPTPASSLDDAEPETVSPNDLISIVPTLALSRIPMPPCHSEEEKSDRNQPQSSEDFPTAYIASAADVKKYAPLQEAAASEALDDDVTAAFVAPAKNGGAFPLGQSFSSLLFEGIHCQALFSPRWSNSTDTSTSFQISVASPGSAEDNDGFQENSISGSVTEDCTSAALTSLTSNPALKQSEESTAPLSVIEICEESEGEMLTPQFSISGQMNSVERLGPEQTHNVHKISGIDMPTPQSTVTIATHSKSKETVGKSKETSENKKSTGDMLIPHSPINRQKSDTEYVQEHKASLKKKSQGDMLTPQPSTTTQGKSLESMGQSLKPKTKKKSAGDMLTPQSSSTDEKFPTDTTGKRVMATTAASKGVAQTFAPASTANVRSDRLTRQISEKNIVVEPTDRATQTVQTSSTSVFAFWRKKKILDLETTERKSQAGMSGTTEGAGSNRNLSKFCVIL